jgi:hypothetical protein
LRVVCCFRLEFLGLTLSLSGATGLIGLVGTGQPVYNLVQGSSWAGDFNSGEGLIYNGVADGNTPTDIAADFDQAETGVGAYIQSATPGSFTATITLFDINFQPIGSFSTSATKTPTRGGFIRQIQAVPWT